MHQVSAALKARVTAKINECVTKINTKHNINMPTVHVRYDINSGRLGGEARLYENTVRVNPVFLNAHTEEYINQTIPHEVAHLGVHQVYRVGRGQVVDAHGHQWKNMMVNVLGIPADRCHSMTVPEGVRVGKPKPKYNYTCSGCNAVVVVGPKHHAKIQAGHHMWHKSCGSSTRLVYAAAAGRVSYAEARRQGTNPAPATPAPQAPAEKVLKPAKTGSKLDQCYTWFQHYVNNVPEGWTLRQICINVFQNEVGMSEAGASTYYNTCKKMYADFC